MGGIGSDLHHLRPQTSRLQGRETNKLCMSVLPSTQQFKLGILVVCYTPLAQLPLVRNLYLYHDWPIRLIYSRCMNYQVIHLSLRLFYYLSGYYSPISQALLHFFIATIQIEVIVQVCYTPRAQLPQSPRAFSTQLNKSLSHLVVGV